MPYGICEAGRQWALVFESWILGACHYERVCRVSQLYLKWGENRAPKIFLAKVTNGILVCGSCACIEELMDGLKKTFSTNEVAVNRPFELNACQVSQTSPESITLSMKCCAAGLSRIELSRAGKMSVTAIADTS